MKLRNILLPLLCVLLALALCGCGQQNAGSGDPPTVPDTPDGTPAPGAATDAETPEPETLHFTCLSETAEYGEMAMTFRLDWADFCVLTREEQTRLADILQQAQLSQLDWEGAPQFLLKYCTSDSALPYETQYLLFVRQGEQTYCRALDNESWFLLPEQQLTQLWLDLGLELNVLYGGSEIVFCSMEYCPEAQQSYTLPEADAASPEQALELLFRQFLEAQKDRSIRRTYRILDVKSVTCHLYDRAYIAANEGDWGWANDPEQLGEQEWCTFCSAGVTCLGTLDTWQPGVLEEQSAAGDVRWGRLWLENHVYHFAPHFPGSE